MGKFLSRIIRRRKGSKMKLVMVGPDSSGKTTLLYRLKTGNTLHTVPTIGFNTEEIKVQGDKVTIWDLGGQEKIRQMWKYYFTNMDILAFVVDSADTDRMTEAHDMLQNIMKNPELDNCVLLVYANKKDVQGSQGSQDVALNLGLTNVDRQRWFVQTSCAVTGEGLLEGLNWAVNEVKLLKEMERKKDRKFKRRRNRF